MEAFRRCSGIDRVSTHPATMGGLVLRLPSQRSRPLQRAQQQCARPRSGAAGAADCSGRRCSSGGSRAGKLVLWRGSAPPSGSSRPMVRTSVAAAAPPAAATSGDAPANAAERGQRLEAMIQLRKLYRNVLRGEVLVDQPHPVYEAPAEVAVGVGAAAAAAEQQQQAGGAGGAAAVATAVAASALDEDEQRRVEEAVEIVAEMELTAEQMKVGLRGLRACPYPYPQLFRPEEQAGAAEQVEERVGNLFDRLEARAGEEVSLLPFPTEAAAHAAIDARNARFRLSIPWAPAGAGSGEGGEEGAGGEEGGASGERQPGTGLSDVTSRLVKAEKAAEQFVARRLQPAVQRVKETSPEGVVQGLKTSAAWAKGVWNRLNGGAPGQADGREASLGLPLPTSSEEARKVAVTQLNLQLDTLEKKLQDASKARETRLRKAGIQGRARMAAELRDMDNDIAALSKALAVRTLQLEMEYVYGALEEEARDIVGDRQGGDLTLALSRRGSSDEIALLVAEFRLLDESLASMAAAVEAREALFIDDSELARLAAEIPDLRVRLGIGDNEVFGGTGFSLVKVKMQIKEGVVKVVDGILFGVRGVKLLFADIGAAGKLFWRAVRGGTLKPREVQALRRTVRDLLTFVPFTIILIIPLTPVGHVLIFGFIQRYFPGFFPSQFTGRRQDLMMKYDELKRQLRDAELQAEAENDEIEYNRKAASAMAVLGRGAAVAAAGGVPAAAAVAAATALGGELELAAAVGAAAAAAGAAAASSLGIGEPSAPELPILDEDEEEEGPAAKAVRQIEEKLVAAENDAYTGDVEEAAAATPRQQHQGSRGGSGGEPSSSGFGH